MKPFVFVSFTFLFLATACDDKDNNELKEITSYPMTVGTEWTYNKEVILKHFAPEDSTKIVKIDTVNTTIKVWIDKDTVLNDTLKVKVFKAQVAGDSFVSEQYMAIDSEGLRRYAYKNAGIGAFAKKAKIINNINSRFEEHFNALNDIFGSLIFESTPRLNIKLPLKRDSKWNYFNGNNSPLNWQIDKEVTGIETIEAGNNSYSCFKVLWKYVNSENMFDGLTVTDWISDKGLIMKKESDKARLLTSADGLINEYCQIFSTLKIKEIKIK